VRALDRKLFRDTAHLKGQMIAVSLVVACGIASWVTMRSVHASLLLSQDAYYREYRFADVFASMRRAPLSLISRIAAVPGVVTVQHRIVHDVTVDVPGLKEPATARVVSIPEIRRPMLNDLHLRSGRWIDPNRPDQVLVSESFATANGLALGDSVGAVINGRWRRLTIVGTALTPEYIYEIRPGDLLPDKRRFGILWMSREALEAAFDMEGAFNDVAITIAHGTNVNEVVGRVDDLISPWGGAGAYGRDEQISNRFLTDEIKGLEVSAGILPVIFLAVAAFLIHLVLSRLVQLQRDQIAILKAFGYESGVVGLHYLGDLQGVLQLPDSALRGSPVALRDLGRHQCACCCGGRLVGGPARDRTPARRSDAAGGACPVSRRPDRANRIEAVSVARRAHHRAQHHPPENEVRACDPGNCDGCCDPDRRPVRLRRDRVPDSGAVRRGAARRRHGLVLRRAT
jgi:hypothetical protein